MKCPRCQHENPAGSSFCLECGARLGLTCGSCGIDLPPGSKFCNKCGTAVSSPTAGQPRFTSPESYTPKHLAEKILTSKSALEGERKQVTVLFADLKGSMELLADRDPDAAIVGEAGVGKSRLVYEFTKSHRLQGWLILESASVSYGKATSYLPVIDL